MFAPPLAWLLSIHTPTCPDPCRVPALSIERARLEEWISTVHDETVRFIREHPFSGPVDEPAPEE